ncbi:hypothetical protein [Gordonia aichiensis]|uniref:Mce-associated membrane protein n=1 Tax=Gordonia aichiensis NBRC 108223 TaxID=1220583 RepID=L7KJW6_9ACTN|nr:hypothetical protein [Gordonia aichiensis]GAC49170.1 hypothetical protein GOACH_10_01380 [Gordonia aichiensis NBRC 108223]
MKNVVARSFAAATRVWSRLIAKIGSLSRTRVRAIAGALAVAVLVAAGLFGYFFAQLHSDNARIEDENTALAVMRKTVPTLLSYRAKEIDKDFDSKYDLLTGKFHDDFKKLSTESIIPEAKKRDLVTNAKVAESGVIGTTGDSVTILMFINQTTSSSDEPTPKIDGSRVKVTTTRADNTWKISALQPV